MVITLTVLRDGTSYPRNLRGSGRGRGRGRESGDPSSKSNDPQDITLDSLQNRWKHTSGRFMR